MPTNALFDAVGELLTHNQASAAEAAFAAADPESAAAAATAASLRHSLTLLHAAANGGAPAMVPLLLEAGALVDARDALGRTPLIVAAGSTVPGTLEVIDALINAQANVDAESTTGETPLIAAIGNTDPAIAAGACAALKAADVTYRVPTQVTCSLAELIQRAAAAPGEVSAVLGVEGGETALPEPGTPAAFPRPPPRTATTLTPTWTEEGTPIVHLEQIFALAPGVRFSTIAADAMAPPRE